MYLIHADLTVLWVQGAADVTLQLSGVLSGKQNPESVTSALTSAMSASHEVRVVNRMWSERCHEL